MGEHFPQPPHTNGKLDHHALRPLFLLGEHIALLGGSEAALRRETKLVEGGKFGCLVDAVFDVALLFQLARFCRDQLKHRIVGH
jgi:hypothetical protein